MLIMYLQLLIQPFIIILKNEMKIDYIVIPILKLKKNMLYIGLNGDINNSEFSTDSLELVLKIPIEYIEKALIRRDAIRAAIQRTEMRKKAIAEISYNGRVWIPNKKWDDRTEIV